MVSIGGQFELVNWISSMVCPCLHLQNYMNSNLGITILNLLCICKCNYSKCNITSNGQIWSTSKGNMPKKC
jgi:hypothetical protein